MPRRAVSCELFVRAAHFTAAEELPHEMRRIRQNRGMDTDRSRISDRPSQPGLNLLWPGLAQIAQGRRGVGCFFLLEAVAGWAMWAWAPDRGALLSIVMALLAAWFLADAYLFERAASAGVRRTCRGG